MDTDDRVPGFPVGKLLTTLTLVVPAVGAFAADWNETHVFNDAWPPHAKFHNAQTITLAVVASVLGLWQLWRPGPPGRDRLRWAALFGTLFWVTQAPAIAFPGTAFVDPGASQQPTSVAGIPLNQVTVLAAVLFPLLAGGYALEVRRIRRARP